LVGHAPCRYWAGKEAFLNKPDLSYVRDLLASTEALFHEIAARMAEARRLQEEARALHNQPAKPCPPKPHNTTPPPPLAR
jgi:hypothetical protein